MTQRRHWLAAPLSLLALAAPTPWALAAGDSALITASGSVAPTASVEVPAQQTSNPPQIATDGRSMTVSSTEPVTLMASVPSQVELSPLELATPNGVAASSVGAEISLRANGSVLVDASTNAGGSQPFGIGQITASVNGSFYSTTDQPLPAGTYTATTTLSVVAQ